MKQIKKPWIFDTDKGLRNLFPDEVKEAYDWVVNNILPLLHITLYDISPVGSYGKKTNNQISSDIDIAVSINAIKNNIIDNTNPLDYINQKLQLANYNTKLIKGFNQVSFAVPLQRKRKGFAQVDFMLSRNLKWSKFIYHSPNFNKKESNYKGVVRTLLMMAVLSESTRNILLKDNDNNTIEVESKVIRMPYGIFSTTRSFMGKRGLVKKSKLLKDFDKEITNEPIEAVKLILGKQYKPADCNSFETIWNIINKPDFINKKYLDLIITKFKIGLLTNNLPIPKELK